MTAVNRKSQNYDALGTSKLLVITGAGASVPLGMPDMQGFNKLIDSRWQGFVSRIFSLKKESENDLEWLLERLSLYEMVVTQHGADDLLRNCISFSGPQNLAQAQELKRHIFETIIRTYGRLSGQRRQKAVEMYHPLYLKLLEAARNDPPVLPIFTTNYDLTYEAISTDTGDFPICTGMERGGEYEVWRPELYARSDGYKFAIFRLHGCSHWMKERQSGLIAFQALPDTASPDYREPCVLYPIPGKEDGIYEEPFRTAYRHLEMLLRVAETIVVIGYSGRDPVIQALLKEALQENPEKKVILVTRSGQLRPGLQDIKMKCTEGNFVHLSEGIEKNSEHLVKHIRGEIELRPEDSLHLSDQSAGAS